MFKLMSLKESLLLAFFDQDKKLRENITPESILEQIRGKLEADLTERAQKVSNERSTFGIRADINILNQILEDIIRKKSNDLLKKRENDIKATENNMNQLMIELAKKNIKTPNYFSTSNFAFESNEMNCSPLYELDDIIRKYGQCPLVSSSCRIKADSIGSTIQSIKLEHQDIQDSMYYDPVGKKKK